MNSLQMVVMDETKVSAGMRGDFDLHSDEFSLVMTDVGLEAAQSTQAGSMLTGLKMPVLDGFHFLSYLMDHGFDLPIVLSNAPDSDRCQHYLLAPERSFSLPVPAGRRPPGLVNTSGTRAPTATMCHGVTLPEFLRFCLEERQTRVLEVSSGSRTAEFHLTFGKLIHAVTGSLEGLPVLLEVLCWQAPRLRILPTLPGLKLSITTEMELVLLQAEALLKQHDATQPHAVRASMPLLRRPSRPVPSFLSVELLSLGWVRGLLGGALRAVAAWASRWGSRFAPGLRARGPRAPGVVSNERGDAGTQSPAR